MADAASISIGLFGGIEIQGKNLSKVTAACFPPLKVRDFQVIC